MKSILGMSLTFHAVVLSAAMSLYTHQKLVHASVADHTVLELQLGLAPKPARARVNSAPTAHAIEDHASLPEKAVPAMETPTPASSSLQQAEPLQGSGVTGNGASAQASASIATHPAPADGAAGVSRTAKAAGMGKPDALPWIVSSPAPEYPRVAQRKGWTGRVAVHVLITTQGTVQQVELASSSGHAELDAAAMAALRRWIFHPAEKDGHVIEAWVVVPVLFRLDD